VVVIDPGHGGPDPGAVGIGGIYEKEIVFDISVQVANLLQQQGVQVLLTRRDDRDLGLEPRVQLANQVRAAAFLSIHANAISLARPDVNGVETFYYYSGGQALAAAVQRQLLADTGMRNRGVKRARFYLLRRAAVPTALVEVGFVTGQEDAPRLADAGFRTQIAIAITRGILNYLGAMR
jgi:N-acetylmuramoyl-L-alanine amidase